MSIINMNTNLDNLFQEAYHFQENGKLQDAEYIYNNILLKKPSHIGAKTMLGMIYVKTKRDIDGIKLLKTSLSKDPKQFWAHNALGVGLLNIKKYQEAVYSFNKALILKPDYVDAYFNLGKTQRALGKYRDAIDSYSKCIDLDKFYADAYNNIGTVYLEDLYEHEKSVISFEKFITLSPQSFFGYFNLGNALRVLKRSEDALANYERAIEINPDYAEAYFNQGSTFTELNRHEEALASYVNAIKVKPDYAEAYLNLGIELARLSRYDDALVSYEHAIKVKPDYAMSYYMQGSIFTRLSRYDDALASYISAIQLEPELNYILGSLIYVKMLLCNWDNINTLVNQLTEKILKQEIVTTSFVTLALIDSSELQKQAAEIYVNDKFPINKVLPSIGKYPKRSKIRIGYFSADFREHPVSHLTAELFELHNRDRFEVFAFSFGVNTKDFMRQRLEKSFDQFIDVKEKSDKEIVLLAREMGIDIAVDLGGFTTDSRTGIFSMRAAPIQVNYLGYAGTMATEYMDYIIADPTIIPIENQSHYSEKIAYLPITYMINDASLIPSEEPLSRKKFELPEKAFIFACFNAPYKITQATFLGWMRILSAVDNSVLWLSSMNQTAKNNLKNNAFECGIDSDRIIFASKIPSVRDHLNRIKLADLFLDTFPYNAHTTSNDALRVGLPVLTLMGQSFPSRVAGSLLKAVNLQELITTNQCDYESLAIDLANNPEQLAQIKNKLKNNYKVSPLCNSKLIAQHIELVYEEMYQRYQKDLLPDHIYIS